MIERYGGGNDDRQKCFYQLQFNKHKFLESERERESEEVEAGDGRTFQGYRLQMIT